MLTRDQFARASVAQTDPFGRRPVPSGVVSGPFNALGNMVQRERAGRQQAEQLEYECAAARQDKSRATTDQLATECDRAYADLKIAQCHLLLIERFEREAADWQARANGLSATPGGQTRAEQARVRASQLMRVAERHRQKARLYQEKGQQEYADVHKQIMRAEQAQPGQPPPRGGGGPPVRRTREAPAPPTPEVTPMPPLPSGSGQ